MVRRTSHRIEVSRNSPHAPAHHAGTRRTIGAGRGGELVSVALAHPPVCSPANSGGGEMHGVRIAHIQCDRGDSRRARERDAIATTIISHVCVWLSEVITPML